ncbi:MAG: FecR domain-containing protein, partial [Gammaproteobacteria bacterium]|nr:FecR domain-containing protein [Gammaproteobacteria bacterium]
MTKSSTRKRFIPHLTALAMAGALAASQVAMAKAMDSFGVAAAVHGQVQLIPSGKSTPIPINSGAVISPGDRLITGTSGGLQVMMTDNSVFTLGSDTQFTLKRYSYDPATSEGEMRASVDKGTYKLVTGHVSEANHGKVSIEMPTGTVTSLGTIFMGEANVDGTGEDTVVLLGPGKEKGASIDEEGAITFEPGTHAMESTVESTDEETGETTTSSEYTIWRAGYAVTISSDGSVS